MLINYYPCLKVWYFERDSSVERSAKHEDNGMEADATDLLHDYGERGAEVIQIRLLRSPIDPGDVLYSNSSYIGA